jgi:hypothetical protein
MEGHGRILAAGHRLSPQRMRDRLLTRLADNDAVLIGTGKLLKSALEAKQRIAPAGEWLLDNFYLIEEQVRTRACTTSRWRPSRTATGGWTRRACGAS